MPAIPQDQIDTTEVAIRFPSLSNLNQNTVQVPYSQIPLKSSVIISFADSIDGKESVGSSHPASQILRDVLQKEFLRKGFRVLDYGSVNATLMELALNKSCKDERFWWRCTPYIGAEEVVLLNQLQDRFAKGEIQEQAFSEELGKQKTAWENRATSSRALQQAIESGKLSADYLFEIKSFQPQKLVKQSYNLNKSAEVRDFIKNYPDLIATFAEKGVYRCTGLGSELKARLLDTKSSEVIWIGQHLISEMTMPENKYLVELGVKRSVTNIDEVTRLIEEYNNKKSAKKSSVNPVPGWRYETTLVGPSLLEGNCVISNRLTDELLQTSTKLAGRVARELVSTIRTEAGATPVSNEAILPSAPDFKANTQDKTIKKNPNSTSFDFFESSTAPVRQSQ